MWEKGWIFITTVSLKKNILTLLSIHTYIPLPYPLSVTSAVKAKPISRVLYGYWFSLDM